MKRFRAGCFGGIALLPIILFAQSEKAATPPSFKPPTPEEIASLPAGERATQEYIARRAQRVKEREATLAQAKAAKDETERKKILDKLAADENAFRTSTADLTRQIQEAQKARLSAPRPVEKQ